MFRLLAPKAVRPPSPKNSAWMNSATDMATMAPQGPSRMAAMAMPTAWPVVPPGSGRLNIMITKEKADTTDSSGTSLVFSPLPSRRVATYQKGRAAA